jgi:hypothetical protein
MVIFFASIAAWISFSLKWESLGICTSKPALIASEVLWVAPQSLT